MRTVLIALGAIAGLCVPAHSQDVAEFYRGKTIRIVVGIGVGSGYDINARLIARFLPAQIPGNPTVIVQNQPGAGSLTMTNQLYAAGPFDGTVIGASFNGLPTTPLLQPTGVRFDPLKLQWIGSSSRETHVTYLWHTVPVDTFEDIRRKQVVVGAQFPGSSQYDYPVLANHLFGFKFKIITGYDSTPKIHLAMERGEVEGNGATNWSTVKTINANWVAEKKIKVLAQWALRRNPELPDVPMVLDLAKTEAERQALLLSLARLEFGRPFFVPPGVPAARVEALRRAFDAVMKNKEFLVEAERIKVDIDPLPGDQVTALVEQVMRTAPETAARVRAAMEAR